MVSRLQDDGHRVVCASPRKVEGIVRSNGFDFHQLPEIDLSFKEEIPKFRSPFRRIKRLAYKYKNASERRRLALEAIDPKKFEKWLVTEDPDLVMIDLELHEYIIKTYNLKVPFVILSQWFSTWKRKGLPFLFQVENHWLRITKGTLRL